MYDKGIAERGLVGGLVREIRLSVIYHARKPVWPRLLAVMAQLPRPRAQACPGMEEGGGNGFRLPVKAGST